MRRTSLVWTPVIALGLAGLGCRHCGDSCRLTGRSSSDAAARPVMMSDGCDTCRDGMAASVRRPFDAGFAPGSFPVTSPSYGTPIYPVGDPVPFRPAGPTPANELPYPAIPSPGVPTAQNGFPVEMGPMGNARTTGELRFGK